MTRVAGRPAATDLLGAFAEKVGIDAAHARPVDEVLVLDNNSDDDSAAVAAAHPVGARVITPDALAELLHAADTYGGLLPNHEAQFWTPQERTAAADGCLDRRSPTVTNGH